MAPPCKDAILEDMKSLGQSLDHKLQDFTSSKVKANATLTKLRASLTKLVGNEQNGSISVSVAASNQYGTAAAAVGFQIQAPRNMLLYITPLLTYNFNWLDLANFINASNAGNFLIQVQAFSPHGRTQLPRLTFAYPLWNDDAGRLYEHSNSGTNVKLTVSPSMSVVEGR